MPPATSNPWATYGKEVDIANLYGLSFPNFERCISPIMLKRLLAVYLSRAKIFSCHLSVHKLELEIFDDCGK